MSVLGVACRHLVNILQLHVVAKARNAGLNTALKLPHFDWQRIAEFGTSPTVNAIALFGGNRWGIAARVTFNVLRLEAPDHIAGCPARTTPPYTIRPQLYRDMRLVEHPEQSTRPLSHIERLSHHRL